VADILGNLVMRIKGDASEGKEAIDSTQSGIKGLISPANLAKGAVMGVAGGIAHMGNQMVPLNQALDRTAGLVDMNSDELRDLAGELTDVTFPLEEVTEGMEMLAQRGVESEEQMRALLPTLDTLADALDTDVSYAVEQADSFMKAMGMSIEDFDEDSAELIHTLETLTDDGIQPLERLMRQASDEFHELDLGADELATTMVALDRNTMSSREATQAMRDAVEEAEGDQDKFRRLIKQTTGDLNEYSERVERANGTMEENAEINERSNTILDKARQRVQEVAFQYGEQLEAVREWSAGLAMSMPFIGKVITGMRTMGSAITGNLLPALKAKAGVITGTVIPALKAKAAVITASVIPALKGLTASLVAIASPIAAVIAVVGALIAIWVLFGDEIRAVMGHIYDNVIGPWQDIFDFLSGIDLYDMGVNIISSLADGIAGSARQIYDTVTDILGGMRDRIKGFFGIRSPARLMIEYGENITEGLEEGMLGRVPQLQSATAETGEAVVRELGGQRGSGGGGGGSDGGRSAPLLSIQNMYVRDDEDIDRLARKINRLRKKQDRRPVL